MANNSYEPHDNQETPAAEGIFGFKNSVEVSAENEKSESKVFEEEMDRPHTVRAGATPAKVELPFNLEYDGGRNLNAEAQNKDSDGDRVNQDEKLQRSGSLRHLLGMGSAAKNQAPKEVRDVMVKRFYCLRPGNFEHAVDDVKQYMDTKTDGTFLSAWLLTEIDHWDHEKERIVIITDKQLLIIKYNFIALRIDDYKRVALQRIQKIQSGRFVYPKNSMMMPREFQTGIRIRWDLNIRMTLWQRWNPLFNKASFITFTQHKAIPLLDKIPPFTLYEDFKQAVIVAVEGTGATFDAVYDEIPMEIYVGALSLLHNSNDMGFSKDRGSVGF